MFTTSPSYVDASYYNTAFEWHGLHVLGGGNVSVEAVAVAAETAFNMLRYRPDLVDLLANGQSRIAITPQGGVVTDTPEFSHLHDDTTFDGRDWSNVIGLAGYSHGYVAVTNEDNVLSLPTDPYHGDQNVGLHEWAHVIHRGAIQQVSSLNSQVIEAYDNAITTGQWAGTYAIQTIYEYFASATEAFFDHTRSPDGVVNDINTRAELQAKDPGIFNLLVSVFGNDSWRDGDWAGGEGNDVLQGLDTSDLLFGGGGNDIIVGGAGSDTVHGGAGNDAIWAGANDAGADLLLGEGGNDTLAGGSGNDTMIGSSGADVMFGGAGSDYIYAGQQGSDSGDASVLTNTAWAGSGSDYVYGDGTSDILGGGSGNDLIWGQAGDDVIYGGQDTAADASNNDIVDAGDGNDSVYGGTGSDNINGGVGNDYLFGGAGSDAVIGGAGLDTLWGGSDDDELTGGMGADLFCFAIGSGSDVLQDFDFAEGDKIDLQGQTYTAGSDSDGDLVLSLSGGGTLTFEGLNTASLNSSWFL
jgi:Ca2+-binding RTX toxin-like protein